RATVGGHGRLQLRPSNLTWPPGERRTNKEKPRGVRNSLGVGNAEKETSRLEPLFHGLRLSSGFDRVRAGRHRTERSLLDWNPRRPVPVLLQAGEKGPAPVVFDEPEDMGAHALAEVVVCPGAVAVRQEVEADEEVGLAAVRRGRAGGRQ